MPDRPPGLMTRQEAVAVLNRGHDAVLTTLQGIPVESFLEIAARPGLGGGDWSAKDLLGHLTSWEAYAVQALESWREGLPAEIDRALRTDGLDAINARDVEQKRRQPYEDVLSAYGATHARLVRLIEETSDEAWASPPTRRARRPLGDSLGRILGGSGLYDHAGAHLPDLRTHLGKA